MKLVLIEDEQAKLRLLLSFASRLTRIEIVNSFINPLEALEWLKKNGVDGLIVDNDMPYLNGESFLDCMPYPVPTILAIGKDEVSSFSHKNKVAGYLVKPYSFYKFIYAVTQIEEALQDKR